MEHHHLRTGSPFTSLVYAHLNKLDHSNQANVHFKEGFSYWELFRQRGRMLEMDPPTGAVINPRRLANGGTNPAQSVVMTSSGSERATIWMERVAWNAEIIPTSEAVFSLNSSCPLMWLPAWMCTAINKWEGKLVEKQRKKSMFTEQILVFFDSGILLQHSGGLTLRQSMWNLFWRIWWKGKNALWCHHVAQCSASEKTPYELWSNLEMVYDTWGVKAAGTFAQFFIMNASLLFHASAPPACYCPAAGFKPDSKMRAAK